MPCKSDYLKATERETASRQFCQHLCYIFESLEKTIPEWIRKGADEYYGSSDRVNEATVLLCATIRAMTPDEKERIVYNGRSAKARAVADFWDRHEAADRARGD